MNKFLRISIVRTGNLHGDIHLSIPSLSINKYADSYYLYLEKGGGDEGYSRIINVLSEILKSWIDKLDKAVSNDVIFLPFDFSDQYIGCLRVRIIDIKTIEIDYGLTVSIRGVDLSPMYASEFDITENEFESDSDLKAIISALDFRSCVVESISNLREESVG